VGTATADGRPHAAHPGEESLFPARHRARTFSRAGTAGRWGRIAAIQNDLHNQIHEDRVGFYGFFESIDDQAVANALWDAAAAWLRTRGGGGGFDTMRGPMSPSVNDECGLLVDGFDTPPTLMMPHNPPYYVALHERYGFVKAKDLLAYEGSGDGPPSGWCGSRSAWPSAPGLRCGA